MPPLPARRVGVPDDDGELLDGDRRAEVVHLWQGGALRASAQRSVEVVEEPAEPPASRPRRARA